MAAKNAMKGRGETRQITARITAHLYNNKSEMAKAIAQTIADDIIRRTAQNDATMTIALAGGETPKPAYCELSKMQLPWDKLRIFATDERITPDKTRSNETMLQNILGEKARIQKLQQNAKAPTLHLALLGIGKDGHTASLFADAMPAEDETKITKVSPTTTPEKRLTLPPITFAKTPRLLLIITGKEKWRILSHPPSPNLPITAILSARKTLTKSPAEVFYAPD